MTPTDDDAPPTDPAESLALIHREQSNLARSLTPDPRLMYWPWGVAWLLGFGLFFLRYGPDERVFVDLPEWLPLVALLVLFLGAGLITGVAGALSSRQMTGPSSRQGAMYGWSWSIAFFAFSLLFARLSDHVAEEWTGLLWAGGLVALTGVLHMAGGVIWNDRNVYVLGVWTILIDLIGILAGPGWHSLIVALAGGGGMLVFGLIAWLRLR